MEENREEQGSKALLVVVIILSMIVGTVCGYFVTTNFLDKKETNNKSNTSNEKTTVYSVADSTISGLVVKLIYFEDDLGCNDGIWEFANDKKIETKDISSARAFEMIDEYKDLNNDGKITYDEIEKSIQKILGKDYKFDSNVDLNKCTGRGYNPKTKELQIVNGNCGGTCGNFYSTEPSYKVVKAVDTNGTLEMELKVVFENDDKKIYSDYAKKDLIATYYEEKNQFLNSKKEVMTLDEVLNKGSDYKFTFKLEDGNYVFVSSEPLK